MKLEKVKIKLPKTEKGVKNFIKNCENRNKFVIDNPEYYKKRLKKAKHDLSRAVREFEDKCWDWTIVKSYYAIFHAANALLSKERGVFSKDHSCLIVGLKYWNLVDDRLFSDLVKVYEGLSDIVSMDLTFQLRKISQYDVEMWEELTEENASMVLEVAKKFVAYVEARI